MDRAAGLSDGGNGGMAILEGFGEMFAHKFVEL